MDWLRSLHASLLFSRDSKPARWAFLALTVAVTVGAWFALAAMASPFLAVKSADGLDLVRVDNARSRKHPLPLKYAARIAALPGVRSTSYQDLQMVLCGSQTVTINAVGKIGTDGPQASDEYSASDMARWRKDPIGLLVSQSAAKACGWHVGQGIAPNDVMGRPLAFHVSGISSQPNHDPSAKAHYDYINPRHSLIAGPGHVLMYYVRARNPDNNQQLAARIDAEFAHDDPPVTAYPDTARSNARSRFGQAQNLVMLVMGALFLSCLLVLASVMAHSASERRARYGMLRVLGFSRRVLATSYVLESAGIMLLGTAMGLGLGQALLHYLPLWLQGKFVHVAPAPWAWTWLPVWLAVLFVLSTAQPCLTALKAKPLDCRED